MKTKFFASRILLIAATFVVGCTATTPTPTAPPANPPTTTPPTAQPTSPPEPILLQYIGHSCTLITAPDGTRIISDPYGDQPAGLAAFPDDLSADAVTVSHSHSDHSSAFAVNGKPEVLSKPGSFQVGMVKITGYQSDHGLVNGEAGGRNTVFVFEIDEVKLVHLGAAGVVTQNDILAALKNADVVIVDIMGDAAHPITDELEQLLERNVRTIIPTHYSFEGHARYYGSATLAEFLPLVPAELAITTQSGSLVPITANMPNQLVILAPAANDNS
ncbi:MAG TPA: MBL fold metallo-hydrolase [Anaerolineae bacterium]|nr:MBL fold metallo-hydrolase [Anaerolineae bacterium]